MRLFIILISLSVYFVLGEVSLAIAQNQHYFVTTNLDTNDGLCNEDCSLREAIAAANDSTGTDTIFIPNATYQLTQGQIILRDHLEVIGSESARTIINGNGNGRVFFINPNFSVLISGVTVQGGITPCGPCCDFRFPGGGIYSVGTLTLVSSVVSSNRAGPGGGIYNEGKLSLDSVIINNNISEIGGSGGGIFSSGFLDLANEGGEFWEQAEKAL